MPRIRPYEAPQGLSLQPDDRGTNAALQAARRGSAAFNEAADATTTVGNMEGRMAESTIRDAGKVAVDYMEHREVSQGSAAYAGLNDKLTQQWNDTAKNADPNDPTVAQRFREKVLEPELEKFGQSFMTEGGQKWGEARVASLRSHMFEKTAADMGTLAADALSVNVKQTANAMSNTAMTDPSSVPHLLEGIDGTIGAMVDSSPNLKGAPAARARMQLTEQMKESIVKSGAIGAIQRAADPEAEAKRWGDKYPDFINGSDLKALSANARQQIRADRMDRAYSEHLQKQATQDQSDKTETGYMQKIYSDDPQQQGAVSAKAIVNDPNLTRTAKERMINVVNRELKPETDAKISAATSTGLFKMMNDPNADQQKVRQAIIDARAKDPGEPGSLTKSDFNDAMKNLTDLKTPEGLDRTAERNEFFKRFAPTIDPSMGDESSLQFGHHTALGQQKMYEAEKALRSAEQRLGPEWRKLYDPAAPEFFGRPGNLMKYRASMQDAATYQSKISKNIGGPNTTVTGVDVQDAPVFQPPPNWQFSASRQQYRDPDGKIYDNAGKPVK